jgi:nitrate reductase molybdenum cofactor assembly chaperone NarJ/NarW
MNLTFKCLSALLDYPTPELKAATAEVREALSRDQRLPWDLLTALVRFIDRIERTDLLELQEQWVGQFDRSKRLALHLYEHSHGESRDRGQAMVNLALAYRMHGLELNASEMPDYLPLFLEFLSQVHPSVAAKYLADATDVLEVLRIRLEDRESPYAVLLKALLTLSNRKADAAEVEAILESEPADPATPEELDRDWAEEHVDFAPGAALKDCAYAGGIARDRAAAFASAGA